jgi:dTDP-4-amino-4,6-dideoxygalactose transaminase
MRVTYDYSITKLEQEAALEVLRSGDPYSGKQEAFLEKEYCRHFGRRYAIAVNSGTAGLHCAVLACDIGVGDEVIAPPNTDWAILYGVLYAGGRPAFCDVEEDTMNLCPSKIEEKITPKTRAIMAVSTAGHPTDFDPVLEIAKSHDLFVINDAAQALGAKYKGKYADMLGDITVTSFGRYKYVSGAGRVAIVATDNEELAEAVHVYSHQGEGRSEESDPIKSYINPSYPDFDRLGYRFSPSEVHCAIARVQLKRFTSGALGPKRRRKHAAYYTKELEGLSPHVITPVERDWAHHSYHRYIIRSGNRNSLFKFLRRRNIQAFIHYAVPLHLFKLFVERYGNCRGQFPVTERLAKEVLTLPSWATLSQTQLEYVVKCIKAFYHKS